MSERERKEKKKVLDNGKMEDCRTMVTYFLVAIDWDKMVDDSFEPLHGRRLGRLGRRIGGWR